MFVIRHFEKVKNVHCFKCRNLRFLSTKEKILVKNNEDIARRYLRPPLNRKVVPLNRSYLKDLFLGKIDKKMFEYPAVFKNDEINTVIKHSVAIESLSNKHLSSHLTEDILQELKKLEVFGLTVPQKYGGAGYTETETKYLLECAGLNPNIARFLGYNEDFSCKLLNLYGSEEQKEKYLRRLAEGKSFMSLAYLENVPLVDITNFQGYALFDEENNQYFVNAEKKWVHNAEKSDLFLLMVKIGLPVTEHQLTKVRFIMLIVERNTPGITVNKIKSKSAQEFDLCDVNFKEVYLPVNSVLGSEAEDGFNVLKTGLSYNNLTNAVLCLTKIKQIIHALAYFIEENNLKNISVKSNFLAQNYLAKLTFFAYALESVVYLVTGRYDTYEKPDLLHETVFAKILALDFLQEAIEIYMKTFGYKSFEQSALLNEAVKTLHFNTVFEENIEFFKLMTAAEGLVSITPSLQHKIKILRQPFDNVWEALKYRFFSRSNIEQYKPKSNLKMEVHSSLSNPADLLEINYAKLQNSIINFFVDKGTLALGNEHVISKFAEVAAYLYAWVACLSRASTSVCYDFNKCFEEVELCTSFAHIADAKIDDIITQEIKYTKLNLCYEKIGKMTFNSKTYPAEHPLSRTY